LAFDASGNLYVGNDNGTNTVSEVTATGVVSTFASGFARPQYLAFDAAGNLYVANFGDGMVSEVTSAGVVSTFASGVGADGLAFDAAGNLYVANNVANAVNKVTPGGVVSTFASSNLNGANAEAFRAIALASPYESPRICSRTASFQPA
jgi:sugar lactone lactonase YvrE